MGLVLWGLPRASLFSTAPPRSRFERSFSLTADNARRADVASLYRPGLRAGDQLGPDGPDMMFVVGFGSSDGLGGAYGIAISLTMLITILLLSAVMLDR